MPLKIDFEVFVNAYNLNIDFELIAIYIDDQKIATFELSKKFNFL